MGPFSDVRSAPAEGAGLTVEASINMSCMWVGGGCTLQDLHEDATPITEKT